MIKDISRTLNIKAPYVRQIHTKTTKIRTVIGEEPIQLAQYIKDKNPKFNRFFMDFNIKRDGKRQLI